MTNDRSFAAHSVPSYPHGSRQISQSGSLYYDRVLAHLPFKVLQKAIQWIEERLFRLSDTSTDNDRLRIQHVDE
jgi:hypothetical protein